MLVAEGATAPSLAPVTVAVEPERFVAETIVAWGLLGLTGAMLSFVEP